MNDQLEILKGENPFLLGWWKSRIPFLVWFWSAGVINFVSFKGCTFPLEREREIVFVTASLCYQHLYAWFYSISYKGKGYYIFPYAYKISQTDNLKTESVQKTHYFFHLFLLITESQSAKQPLLVFFTRVCVYVCVCVRVTWGKRENFMCSKVLFECPKEMQQ